MTSGSIPDNGNNFSLTKESTGTLILDSANTYGGVTTVNQGALRVQNNQALGGTASGTFVRDGAQLQLHTASRGSPVTVSNELLILSGTGIFNTGALQHTGGNNAWHVPIIL